MPNDGEDLAPACRHESPPLPLESRAEAAAGAVTDTGRVAADGHGAAVAPAVFELPAAQPPGVQSVEQQASAPAQAEDLTALAAPSAVPARRRSAWFANLRWLAGVLLAVFLIRSFVGEATIIPTSSMERTILVGDHVFLHKLLYGPRVPLTGWRLPAWRPINRQDIVAFRYPRDPTLIYVKRVIGLGGDQVEIRRNQVFLNGHQLPEPYTIHVNSTLRENFGPIVVPVDHVFVMGDNRDNSSDSRFWGPVPTENVIGEPLLVYWSYEAPSEAWLREGTMNRLHFYSDVARNFFAKTRWRRTGLLL